MPVSATIPLELLEAHPLNSNELPADRFAALKAHIAAGHRYPPLIVRPLSQTASDASASVRYQLLDGHHRARALRELGHGQARCDVWDVDDAQALMLLATLNRLTGRDNPHKRGALLVALRAKAGRPLAALTDLLPERRQELAALLRLQRPVPRPRAAPPVDRAPVCFFLSAADRRTLDQTLRARGGPREAALMQCIRAAEAKPSRR